jgi:hypothetical protein
MANDEDYMHISEGKEGEQNDEDLATVRVRKRIQTFNQSSCSRR